MKVSSFSASDWTSMNITKPENPGSGFLWAVGGGAVLTREAGLVQQMLTEARTLRLVRANRCLLSAHRPVFSTLSAGRSLVIHWTCMSVNTTEFNRPLTYHVVSVVKDAGCAVLGRLNFHHVIYICQLEQQQQQQKLGQWCVHKLRIMSLLFFSILYRDSFCYHDDTKGNMSLRKYTGCFTWPQCLEDISPKHRPPLFSLPPRVYTFIFTLLFRSHVNISKSGSHVEGGILGSPIRRPPAEQTQTRQAETVLFSKF